MVTKSFNYLALYDANYKRIMENLKAIARASKEVIGWLEDYATSSCTFSTLS